MKFIVYLKSAIALGPGRTKNPNLHLSGASGFMGKCGHHFPSFFPLWLKKGHWIANSAYDLIVRHVADVNQIIPNPCLPAF